MMKSLFQQGSTDVHHHLHTIGKICLMVAGLVASAIAILVKTIPPLVSDDHAAVVFYHVQAKHLLDEFMLIGGLTFVALLGITTWFICLYSSFRTAGPLYRIARNLEALIRQPRPTLLSVRPSDHLQDEAAGLNRSEQALVSHYASMQEKASKVRQLITTADDVTLRSAISELRQEFDRAKL